MPQSYRKAGLPEDVLVIISSYVAPWDNKGHLPTLSFCSTVRPRPLETTEQSATPWTNPTEFTRWGHQGHQDRKRGLGVYLLGQTTKSLRSLTFFFFSFLCVHNPASLSMSWPSVTWLIKNGPSVWITENSNDGQLEKPVHISRSNTFVLNVCWTLAGKREKGRNPSIHVNSMTVSKIHYCTVTAI